MMVKNSSRIMAILQAIFVTILWASSWVLIKVGLRNDMPAITFAGLRYGLAWLCLLPFVLFKREQRLALMQLPRSAWVRLGILGLVFYTLTQGAQFLSLAYLPAAMASLLLNLTPMVVGIAGIFLLNERPIPSQWFGIGLATLGVGFYFLPISLPQAQVIGVIIAIVGVLANAGSSLLGREINRQRLLSPLLITFLSMGIGSGLLLIIGSIAQGFGSMTWQDWGIVAWLALVNTAFAFTLWNHTLRTLTAVESSVINSLMMPQIAILAYLFLGETLSTKEIWGLVLVGIGVLIVQLKRQNQVQSRKHV
ncbi:MAG: DMT family transporter [Anaerolineales bacterium]|jgi:drug/metabolite transporter (DMT)-like permease